MQVKIETLQKLIRLQIEANRFCFDKTRADDIVRNKAELKRLQDELIKSIYDKK